MKTSELSGVQLDWAVAQCEKHEVKFECGLLFLTTPNITYGDIYRPSEDWEQGGPIMEREKINIRFITPNASTSPCWAYISMESDDFNVEGWGDTPLVAAMRCYVANKLGEEVEIPEELK